MTRSIVAALTWAAVAVTAPVRPVSTPEHADTRAYNIALGVACGYCHTDGSFADSSQPVFDFARRMERMVAGLNDGPLKALGGVACWSCHRGHPTPPRLPPANWESIAAAHASEFTGRDDLSLAMSVYSASLGVGCEHCHVEGDRTAATRRLHRTVAAMLTIFDVIPTFFDSAVRAPRTQCYMCHQGRTTVERRPVQDRP